VSFGGTPKRTDDEARANQDEEVSA
jgi:hypothetical protein